MFLFWCLIRRLMFIAACQKSMSDVWCLLSDIRHLMFVVWYQTSDVSRLFSDVHQTSYVFVLMSDVWCLLSDVSNLMFVVRSLFSDVYQKSDVCCLITDVRRLMFVVRFMFVFWCRCQTSDVWCLLSDAMPDVWCLLSDVLCQTNDVFRFQTSCCVMSVVWCQMSDVRRPMFVVYQTTNIYLSDVHQTSYVCVDVWCQTSDVCCLMPDVWCLLSAVCCQISDISCLTLDVMSDIWCLMSGVWCLLSDVRHLTFKKNIRHLTADIRRLTSGNKHQTEELWGALRSDQFPWEWLGRVIESAFHKIWPVMSDVRRLMFVVRFQTSDVWRLLFDARCLMWDVWCLLSDVSRLMSDV